MASINDYLRWRGDLLFDERPFNDVDNVVLSLLSYVGFWNIIPSEAQGGGIRLADACDLLLKRAGSNLAAHLYTLAAIDREFLELLEASARFADVWLSAYVDIVNKSAPLQFAAFTADLPNGECYVAFRGTDNTIAGWREDFMLSFTTTAAQRRAKGYLQRALQHTADRDAPVRVGGHSKGGNLAEYAARYCTADQRSRIVCVYSNDGPGMEPAVFAQDPAMAADVNVRRIIPTFSVVGSLFIKDLGSSIIVKSSARGIEQHDPTTWQVVCDGMDEAPCLLPECVDLNEAIATWTCKLSLKERKSVIDDIFDALDAAGAQKLDDIASSPDKLQRVLSALGKTNERSREVVLSLVQCALESSVTSIRKAAKKTFARLLSGDDEQG